MPSLADVRYLKSTASRSYAEKFGLGSQPSLDSYRVSDDDMAAGSTLGAPRVCCVLKATGAIEKVFCVDAGRSLIGTFLMQHWESDSGTRIRRLPGTFGIHPEYQDHDYLLENGVEVTESVFALNRGGVGSPDPPLVYVLIRYCNTLPETIAMDTYAFCNLAGDTLRNIDARWNARLHGIEAFDRDDRRFARFVGASMRPQSWEVTADRAKPVGVRSPGALSNRISARRRPLGILRFQHELKTDEPVTFWFVLGVAADGEKALESAVRNAPEAREAFNATRAFFRNALSFSQVLTPNPDVNHGVTWAKANMLRVQLRTNGDCCFTNSPTRSSKAVGRDTSLYALGSDYVTPEFSRDSLCGFLKRQANNGMIVEWYDMLTGETDDYGLNINDNTPLLILAVAHHAMCSGDRDFLKHAYRYAKRAAEHILRCRDRRGLVWCTSRETGARGIAGWRNIIPHYRISGAPTELNSECYGALRAMANMARALGCKRDAKHFDGEAAALRAAINRHLYNPENGLYLLALDVDGARRSEESIDLVFPVLYGVAERDVAERIVRRLSAEDFWTPAGLRTIPHNAPDYSPSEASGLLGGVWVGVSFWYAMCASPFLPEKMEESLATTFQNYSRDPRRYNTVPGQFSEWLHGETLVNAGMMLSPWFPPRYLWAAIEGAAGFHPTFEGATLSPRMPPSWSWVAVRNLPYQGRSLTWFVIRDEDGLQGYANAELDSSIPLMKLEEDVTDDFEVAGDDVCAVALRDAKRVLVFVGNSAPHAITTRLRVRHMRARRVRS
ncbi:MAG: MGH1-like glycoside hydrolase domain-containing protein, partial [Vulcanimicrobiaceae bacterium]